MRRELGAGDAEVAGLAHHASELLEEAGRRALGLSDFAAARRIYARGEAVLARDDPLRAELVTGLAEALFDCGLPRESQLAARDASELAHRLGSAAMRARTALVLVRAEVWCDDRPLDGALVEVREMVAELERSGDDRSIVWGLMTLSALTFYGALFAESLNASSRAVARAQRSNPTQLPYCVVGMCRALVRAPSPTADEAARRCDEALSLTQADTIHAAIIENDLAFAEAISGRFGSARTRFDRIWRIFEQLAVDAFCQATLQDAGMCALLAGDFEDAEVTFRRCGELARSIDRLFSAEGAALHARALARLGRYTDALAEAENAARRSPNNDIEAQVWWRIAAALALSGLVDFRKAQTVARDAVVIARATQAPLLLGDALSAHGEVLLAEGRTAEAEATLQEAVAVYGAKGIAPAITATGELLERDAEMPAQR